MEKKCDLVVVGESNVDMIVSGLDTLPVLGTERIASEFEKLY
jgi:CRISPR/Cas system CMR-associated protein Cmr3 (group 5 of RAMP superfamily)